MAYSEVLLIEDVDHLGRAGELVRVRPGFARNYIIPQRKGVRATKAALRMQERLKTERAARAERERAEAEQIAQTVQSIELTVHVKVDPDGHMYGSVGAPDVARMLIEQGVEVERRNVDLPHAIKELGIHHVPLRLNEGVRAEVLLKILPEGVSEEQFFGAIAEQQEMHGDPQYQDYYS